MCESDVTGCDSVFLAGRSSVPNQRVKAGVQMVEESYKQCNRKTVFVGDAQGGRWRGDCYSRRVTG